MLELQRRELLGLGVVLLQLVLRGLFERLGVQLVQPLLGGLCQLPERRDLRAVPSGHVLLRNGLDLVLHLPGQHIFHGRRDVLHPVPQRVLFLLGLLLVPRVPGRPGLLLLLLDRLRLLRPRDCIAVGVLLRQLRARELPGLVRGVVVHSGARGVLRLHLGGHGSQALLARPVPALVGPDVVLALPNGQHHHVVESVVVLGLSGGKLDVGPGHDLLQRLRRRVCLRNGGERLR